MLKTLLRNIVHFPTLRMDFYFLVEKGIFLQFLGKNKTYSVTDLVCKWKGRVYFSGKNLLYRKSRNFVNVQASRTMNMCTVKLRNDLIRAQITPQKEKATNTTAGCDWSSLSLGSIKKISALNKTESEIWRQYMN